MQVPQEMAADENPGSSTSARIPFHERESSLVDGKKRTDEINFPADSSRGLLALLSRRFSDSIEFWEGQMLQGIAFVGNF